MSATFIDAITSHQRVLESAPDSKLVISGKTQNGETLYKTVSKMVGILLEILYKISNGKYGCSQEIVNVSLVKDANGDPGVLTQKLIDFLHKRGFVMNTQFVEIDTKSGAFL
ncbi:MAG: hypothetical protein FJZ59_07275 [Chlamydiae bacterium]|jgi:hypothetical protein|nr:hypothetical protein [Chlamydiota bacterium]